MQINGGSMYQMKWTLKITGIILFLIFGFFPMGWAQESEVQQPLDFGFYYTIQKGDTLWDLSQRFYNSQWDWPGLWEMNQEIKNPHQIIPGQKITIFLKSEAPIAKATIAKAVVQEPPETAKPMLPPTISPSFTYPEISHVGFIKTTVERSLGNIIREKDGNLMMSAHDIIYINPRGKDLLVPGKIYQIFDTENIKETLNDRKFVGIKHLIKAEIKILENHGSYVTAIITNSYRDASVNDRIMAYYERDTLLSVQENPTPIKASLICSEENTVMINNYQIAFIDQGSKNNVQPGQIYKILQANKSAFDGSDSNWWSWKDKKAPLLDSLDSGRLIVLHTEDISATVMILSSKRDIYPGDMVD